MNVEVLEAIEADSSRLAKEALLPKLDADLQRLVKLALDPDVTFGVTIDEDEARASVPVLWTYSRKEDETPFVSALESLLRALMKRELTGDAAIKAMWHVIYAAPSALHAKWTARIINRNLRAGFDIRTFNKVFGEGAVAKFGVQLAEAYDPEMELKGLWFVQRKLDGNRVVFIDREARSRSGKLYPNCQHVVDEIESKDPDFFDHWVLDGEMMGDLGFDQSSGALRRISQEGRQQANFTYWAFDLIARKDWERQETVSLAARERDLREVVGKMELETVKIVPTERLVDPTHSQIMEACKRFVADGFEGAMLKDVSSPYVFKRGRNLLKAKLFKDADLVVTGAYEGKGRHKGRLGGLIIEGVVEGNQTKTKVGSGFSDELRTEIWRTPRRWLGATVQVNYQDAGSKGALRFPVFVTRREDKE